MPRKLSIRFSELRLKTHLIQFSATDDNMQPWSKFWFFFELTPRASDYPEKPFFTPARFLFSCATCPECFQCTNSSPCSTCKADKHRLPLCNILCSTHFLWVCTEHHRSALSKPRSFFPTALLAEANQVENAYSMLLS